MDVVDDVQKLYISQNGDLFRTSLEKRTGALVPVVEVFRITDVEFLQKQAYAIFNVRGEQKMVVIISQTIFHATSRMRRSIEIFQIRPSRIL